MTRVCYILDYVLFRWRCKLELVSIFYSELQFFFSNEGGIKSFSFERAHIWQICCPYTTEIESLSTKSDPQKKDIRKISTIWTLINMNVLVFGSLWQLHLTKCKKWVIGEAGCMEPVYTIFVTYFLKQKTNNKSKTNEWWFCR